MQLNSRVKYHSRFLVLSFVATVVLAGCVQKQINVGADSSGKWQFAVSGDSRNCGDVVMPEIAKMANEHRVQFYWHLGDFRALFKIDEDFASDPAHASVKTLEDYRKVAWDDFIQHQLNPFGKTRLYLGIGNHETIAKTREEYISTFKNWLGGGNNSIYYHWVQNGVDFINLDNATDDQFDEAQMKWFLAVIEADQKNPQIQTVVIGMHKALPDSISFGHSMSESKNAISIDTGRQVYHAALDLKNIAHKNVYLLGSHSHFFMDGTFNTDYWKKNGGILPGWIIGTAGAERIPLPAKAKDANHAETHVYGYLLATVDPQQGNQIRFDFQRVEISDVLPEITNLYGKDLVKFCFDQNARKPAK